MKRLPRQFLASPSGPAGRSLRRRRQTLWTVLLAVLLPLAVMLYLQYRWLADLERSSALASRATLRNYLEAVDKDVQYLYAKNAERALNLPASLLNPEYAHKLVYLFQKKSVPGASLFFVVNFEPKVNAEGEKTWLSTFGPDGKPLEATEGQVQAIIMAGAPLQVLHRRSVKLSTVAVSVYEQDPRHRVLLNPITDDSWQVIGVAGMILDPEYFRREVLPAALAKALPPDPRDLVAVVRDASGQVVWPAEPPPVQAGSEGDEVSAPFSYVFTDWRLSLRGRHATPAQWARANFAFNLTLSLGLGVALISGIALALRTAAKAMTLSEMKNDFVSNVSHELRTPLASIRVFGELMRLGRVKEPEKVREYGEYIESESRRLTQLINNILDFSRIESGRKVYHFEETDLVEVVTEALKTCEVRLNQNGFQVDLQRPVAPLPPLRLDSGGISQTLCNLLDNAVKYSRDGSRAIHVGVRREGRHAVVWVEDHGIGISREEQPRIFDRFHRVGTGLVHEVRGSGLGLSIVRHIVEAHGGEIRVDSEPDRGSTFSLYLPLEEPAGSPPAAPQLAPGVQPQGSGGV